MFDTFWKSLRLSMPVLLMATGGGWFGDSLGELLHRFLGEGQADLLYLAKAAAGLAMFLASAWWMYCMRRDYLPVQVLARTGIVRPARVLVLAVSKPNFDFDEALRRLSLHRGGSVLLTGELDQDCRLEGGWNWQQLLRALRPHLAGLERVHLIGSRGGSYGELGRCTAFLRRYLPRHCAIERHGQPVDFEDIDAVLQAIDAEVAAARQALEKLGDGEVMLDGTGGTKATSIAVALYTTRYPRLQFQYVSNAGEIQAFNVVTRKEGDIE